MDRAEIITRVEDEIAWSMNDAENEPDKETRIEMKKNVHALQLVLQFYMDNTK